MASPAPGASGSQPIKPAFLSHQVQVDEKGTTLHFFDLPKTNKKYDLKLVGKIHQASHQHGIDDIKLTKWEKIAGRKWVAVKVQGAHGEEYQKIEAAEARSRFGITKDQYKKHIKDKGYDFTDLIQQKIAEKAKGHEAEIGDAYKEQAQKETLTPKIKHLEEAIKWYSAACASQSKDPDTIRKLNAAKFTLGEVLLQQDSIQHADKCFDLLAQAALAGDRNALSALENPEKFLLKQGIQEQITIPLSSAKCHLAKVYEKDPKKVSQAKTLYEEAAREGHLDANYHLGRMFEQGLGGSVDLKQAAKYYAVAADKGHAEALNRVGELYSPEKKSVAKGQQEAPVVPNMPKANMPKAIESFARAAAKGHQGALGHLQEIANTSEDPKEKGLAQKRLGDIYRLGLGVNKDINKAIELYGEARLKGNQEAEASLIALSESPNEGKTSAQYVLGKIYLMSRVDQFGTGVALLQEAAKDGHVEAAYELGKWHANKDAPKAMQFLHQAAKAGHTEAFKKLEAIAKKEEPGQQRAHPGQQIAQLKLAQLYEEGYMEKVGESYTQKQDIEKAVDYYAKAAAGSNKEILSQIERKAVGREAVGRAKEPLFAGGKLLEKLVEMHIKKIENARDFPDAEMCLAQAAGKKGRGNAAYVLGKKLAAVDKPDKAKEFYLDAVKDGQPDAQVALARMYLEDRGQLGQRQNEKDKVVFDLLKSAVGHKEIRIESTIQAKFLLGELYRDGKGVKKDLFEALSCFAGVHPGAKVPSSEPENVRVEFMATQVDAFVEMQKMADGDPRGRLPAKKWLDNDARYSSGMFDSKVASEVQRETGFKLLNRSKFLKNTTVKTDNENRAVQCFAAAARKGDLRSVIELQKLSSSNENSNALAKEILSELFSNDGQELAGKSVDQYIWKEGDLYELGCMYREGANYQAPGEDADRVAGHGIKDIQKALIVLGKAAEQGHKGSIAAIEEMAKGSMEARILLGNIRAKELPEDAIRLYQEVISSQKANAMEKQKAIKALAAVKTQGALEALRSLAYDMKPESQENRVFSQVALAKRLVEESSQQAKERRELEGKLRAEQAKIERGIGSQQDLQKTQELVDALKAQMTQLASKEVIVALGNEAMKLLEEVESATRGDAAKRSVWGSTVKDLSRMYLARAQQADRANNAPIKQEYVNRLAEMTTQAIDAKMISPDELNKTLEAISRLNPLDEGLKSKLDKIQEALARGNFELAKTKPGEVNFAKLSKAAEFGQREALAQMGTLLDKGNPRAIRFYENRAIENFAQSLEAPDAGRIELQERVKENNDVIKDATEKLETLAKRGNVEAHLSLGRVYQERYKIDPSYDNREAALLHFRTAAEKKDVEGAQALRKMYVALGDEQVKRAQDAQDETQKTQGLNAATHYYKEAIKPWKVVSGGKTKILAATTECLMKYGDVCAELSASVLTSKSSTQKLLQIAVKSFEQAIKLGFEPAKVRLADIYFNRPVDGKRNPIKGIELFLEATKSPDDRVKGEAFLHLGEMYLADFLGQSQEPHSKALEASKAKVRAVGSSKVQEKIRALTTHYEQEINELRTKEASEEEIEAQIVELRKQYKLELALELAVDCLLQAANKGNIAAKEQLASMFLTGKQNNSVYGSNASGTANQLKEIQKHVREALVARKPQASEEVEAYLEQTITGFLEHSQNTKDTQRLLSQHYKHRVLNCLRESARRNIPKAIELLAQAVNLNDESALACLKEIANGPEKPKSTIMLEGEEIPIDIECMVLAQLKLAQFAEAVEKIDEAITYYLQAAQIDDNQAFEKLEGLAASPDQHIRSLAEHAIGKVYLRLSEEHAAQAISQGRDTDLKSVLDMQGREYKKQAAEWFNRAAARGNVETQKMFYMNRTPQEMNKAEDRGDAIRFLSKLAEQGDKEASSYLATIYEAQAKQDSWGAGVQAKRYQQKVKALDPVSDQSEHVSHPKGVLDAFRGHSVQQKDIEGLVEMAKSQSQDSVKAEWALKHLALGEIAELAKEKITLVPKTQALVQYELGKLIIERYEKLRVASDGSLKQGATLHMQEREQGQLIEGMDYLAKAAKGGDRQAVAYLRALGESANRVISREAAGVLRNIDVA